MNIVYLIGNGFDLNLGMKAAYSDFYAHLLKLKDVAPHIKKLREEIDSNLENWSDFELGLGKYLEKIDEEEAIALREDVLELLSKYIDKEEKRCGIEDCRLNTCLDHMAMTDCRCQMWKT